MKYTFLKFTGSYCRAQKLQACDVGAPQLISLFCEYNIFYCAVYVFDGLISAKNSFKLLFNKVY